MSFLDHGIVNCEAFVTFVNILLINVIVKFLYMLSEFDQFL